MSKVAGLMTLDKIPKRVTFTKAELLVMEWALVKFEHQDYGDIDDEVVDCEMGIIARAKAKVQRALKF